METTTGQTRRADSLLFHDAFHASPIGIAIEDMGGQPVFVNPALCSMLGFTEDEMQSKHCVDFSPPEDSEKDWSLFQQLRAGSINHYQIEKRYFRRDGSLMWGRLSVTLVKDCPSPLVLAMLQDITEKKKAEESLRNSEERLRLAQQAAQMGAFEWNIRTGVDAWTPELESIYGLPPGGFAGTHAAFINLVHPDDRAAVVKLVDSSLKTGQPTRGEWRVVWPDGSIRWIVGRWQVFMDESGQPLRMIGVNLDVTERKQMEEALSWMTRKLVEAQEQERARIARELHDDINQRLAMLAIELEDVQKNRPELPSDVRSRIQQLRDRTSQVSTDVQALSHTLHSSTLEFLGLVGGMRSWCRDFGERQGIEIEFRAEVHNAVSAEIKHCFFRVLQEALHNAAKHSGVKRIDVQIRENSGEIHLMVKDLGRGFDSEARRGCGLGLTSMQERVRLVNGTIAIQSKPMAGTTIDVRVPFTSEKFSEQAAG